MKKAELGCTLSHIKCIMEAENRGDEYTIICEDDINMVTMRFWDFTFKDIINSRNVEHETLSPLYSIFLSIFIYSSYCLIKKPK